MASNPAVSAVRAAKTAKERAKVIERIIDGVGAEPDGLAWRAHFFTGLREARLWPMIR